MLETPENLLTASSIHCSRDQSNPYKHLEFRIEPSDQPISKILGLLPTEHP